MPKLGIRFEPPSLILVYQFNESKWHQRVMPVRNFHKDSNVYFVASQLKSRHEAFLKAVPLISIEKMLRILQEHQRGVPIKLILEKVQAEYEVNPEEDLNKLSDDQLERKKLIMESSFVANQIQQSDPDFEYDRQVDFDEQKLESGWDIDNDVKENDGGDDFW